MSVPSRMTQAEPVRISVPFFSGNWWLGAYPGCSDAMIMTSRTALISWKADTLFILLGTRIFGLQANQWIESLFTLFPGGYPNHAGTEKPLGLPGPSNTLLECKPAARLPPAFSPLVPQLSCCRTSSPSTFCKLYSLDFRTESNREISFSWKVQTTAI